MRAKQVSLEGKGAEDLDKRLHPFFMNQMKVDDGREMLSPISYFC
jgi:hypothetical protein